MLHKRVEILCPFFLQPGEIEQNEGEQEEIEVSVPGNVAMKFGKTCQIEKGKKNKKN